MRTFELPREALTLPERTSSGARIKAPLIRAYAQQNEAFTQCDQELERLIEALRRASAESDPPPSLRPLPSGRLPFDSIQEEGQATG